MVDKNKSHEWNLSHLFNSDDDPQIHEKRKIWGRETRKFVDRWKDRTDYTQDPLILRQALDEFDLWLTNYGLEADEVFYFHLRSTQDENNPKIKAACNKVEEFTIKLENDTQFFTHRIAKIPKEKQSLFLENPQLRKYKHFLQKSFENAKYLLSEPEEKILNLKSPQSYSLWVKMTSSFLAKEEAIVLDENNKKTKKTFADLMSLISSPKKKVRDDAARAFNEILAKHVDVAENEINAVLQDKKVNDNLRRLKRPDEARHVSDDIETEVVDAMLEAVTKSFTISQRFYKLKAEVLGVKKLKYYERNVDLAHANKDYSYEDSVKLIQKVFSNLDKEFLDIFNDFNNKGLIDAFPRKGKRSGAFCAATLKTAPTYILLNHTNKIRDVTTIAHEVGHGINNELTRKKQPAIYFGTPLSTAEVASTFMEDFVFQELTKEANDELKFAIMMQKLNDDVSTIMRQVACYKFEQELHKTFREKGHLSKEDIGKIFQKHMSAYMGEFVEQSPGSENWWVYWNHIRSFFYNYSYASGLLISKALQSSVKKDPRFIEKVKEFLSAGLSTSPRQIFLKTGIDISKKEFWLTGLAEIDALLKETEKLAKKLKKV